MTSDGDILLGGGNDRLFGIICDALGKSEWKTDARFISNAMRVANRAAIDGLIQRHLIEHTTQHWLEVFEGTGLPYAAINDIQATLEHKHVLARDMVVEKHHQFCGPIKMVNHPVKYSAIQPSVRSAPPVLGQHTDEILRDLGKTNNEVDALRREGVVG